MEVPGELAASEPRSKLGCERALPCLLAGLRSGRERRERPWGTQAKRAARISTPPERRKANASSQRGPQRRDPSGGIIEASAILFSVSSRSSPLSRWTRISATKSYRRRRTRSDRWLSSPLPAAFAAGVLVVEGSELSHLSPRPQESGQASSRNP